MSDDLALLMSNQCIRYITACFHIVISELIGIYIDL